MGDRFGEGNALFLLAWAYRGAGRVNDARTAIEDALRIATQDDNDVWHAHWLTELARIQRFAHSVDVDDPFHEPGMSQSVLPLTGLT